MHTCHADPFCAAAVEQLVLQPIRKIEGHVKLPGSKSLSNRILLLAALSEGTTEVQNLLVSTYILPCKSNSIEVMSNSIGATTTQIILQMTTVQS